MTETKTLNGLVKVRRNYGPSFLDVLLAWFFYGIFRMTLFSLFPLGWSFFGLILNYMLLFFAITITIRALFYPRYSYTFQKEIGDEESSTTQESFHEAHTQESEVKSEPKSELKPELESSKKSGSDVLKESKLEHEEVKLQYCSYCGCEVPEYARFCSSCGERLR